MKSKNTLIYCTSATLVLIGLSIFILTVAIAISFAVEIGAQTGVDKYREGLIEGFDKGHAQGVEDTIKAILLSPQTDPVDQLFPPLSPDMKPYDDDIDFLPSNKIGSSQS